MNKLQIAVLLIAIGLFIFGLTRINKNSTQNSAPTSQPEAKIIAGSFDKNKFKTDEEWKKILTNEQFQILRQEGTETPYTGELLKEKRKGTYYSVGCDKPLFSSNAKYESNTGWPSFFEPINPDSVVLKEDTSYGTTRVEVLDTCGNHLGHVFDDGPEPTGKRYCMNSVALRFIPDEE